MNLVFVFFISILLAGLISVFLYQLGKDSFPQLMKYVPSIASALSIGVIYLKMILISQQYEPITDIVHMMILSVFVVSL